MSKYKIHKFPKSRIATIDVGILGKKKNHVVALLEIDVTEGRKMIKQLKSERKKVSFTAWLVKTISDNLKNYEKVSSFLKGSRKQIIYEDINVTLLVEKTTLAGDKIPLPLIIKNADGKSIQQITLEIEQAKNEELTENNFILKRKAKWYEQLYYGMPGFFRRLVWKIILNNPKIAFGYMGNASITSISMFGKHSGWFVGSTIHPIMFGVGSLVKKPWVVDDEIKIREILNLTVHMDHDVIDGADMARFVNDLANNLTNVNF